MACIAKPSVAEREGRERSCPGAGSRDSGGRGPTRFRAPRALLPGLLAPFLALSWAFPASGATPAGADSAGARALRLRQAALGIGLENVGVDTLAGPRLVWENRRTRHPLDALGRVEQVAGTLPETGFERRYGLVAAAFAPEVRPPHPVLQVAWRSDPEMPSLFRPEYGAVEAPGATRFRVIYPSDRSFVAPPSGRERPTSRGVDLLVGPLLEYELGHVYDPVLFRLDLQLTLRANPWPGGVTRAALVLPIHDDFGEDPLHPDRGRTSAGPVAIDQYTWLPRIGLVSASAGYFGDNRYGASLGAARPLAEGSLLLDLQADATGFLSFAEGIEYSTPTRVSGFAALAWRPGLDVTVRGQVARWLLEDEGAELEIRRALGDLDVGFFARSIRGGDHLLGVRLGLPVPPMTRPASAFRLMPVERFTLDYQSRSEPVGSAISGVPSREEFLRGLDAPGLAANRDRFRRARGERVTHAPEPPSFVSITGMTGFLHTPWAGVLPDRGVEAGWTHVDRRWAWEQRREHDNEIQYVTMGFLPRIEVGLRRTVFPGLTSFEDQVPGSELTDTDYMASGRVSLLVPSEGHPGLAVGVEDIRGTRRFHSTYAVGGVPFRIQQMQGRLALGYAFHAFEAYRRTLDGVFGAVEMTPWRALALQTEYDSEKWNVGAALAAPFGLRFRVAWLHTQSPSIGAGWYLSLP